MRLIDPHSVLVMYSNKKRMYILRFITFASLFIKSLSNQWNCFSMIFFVHNKHKIHLSQIIMLWTTNHKWLQRLQLYIKIPTNTDSDDKSKRVNTKNGITSLLLMSFYELWLEMPQLFVHLCISWHRVLFCVGLRVKVVHFST